MKKKRNLVKNKSNEMNSSIAETTEDNETNENDESNNDDQQNSDSVLVSNRYFNPNSYKPLVDKLIDERDQKALEDPFTAQQEECQDIFILLKKVTIYLKFQQEDILIAIMH